MGEPFFQCDGEPKAAGDLGEDGGEIGGAEGLGEEFESGGAGLLAQPVGEVLAVADEPAREVEDAADARGCPAGRARPAGRGRPVGRRGVARGVSLDGLSGAGWRGHERNKNIGVGQKSRNLFLSEGPSHAGGNLSGIKLCFDEALSVDCPFGHQGRTTLYFPTNWLHCFGCWRPQHNVCAGRPQAIGGAEGILLSAVTAPG